MSISLTPEQEDFIQTKLQAGKYHSAEEILETAFRLLDEYDCSEAEWVETVRVKLMLPWKLPSILLLWMEKPLLIVF